MTKNLLQIVVCYALGLVGGIFLLIPIVGRLAVVFLIYGAVLGLPILLIAVLVFILLRPVILRHLVAWCVMAPAVAVIAWMTIEWYTSYAFRGNNVYWYLSLRNVWERAGIVFLCASIGSAAFWHWNRHERA